MKYLLYVSFLLAIGCSPKTNVCTYNYQGTDPITHVFSSTLNVRITGDLHLTFLKIGDIHTLRVQQVIKGWFDQPIDPTDTLIVLYMDGSISKMNTKKPYYPEKIATGGGKYSIREYSIYRPEYILNSEDLATLQSKPIKIIRLHIGQFDYTTYPDEYTAPKIQRAATCIL